MKLVSPCLILFINYKIAPKSARPAINSPQEILSSIENQHSKFKFY